MVSTTDLKSGVTTKCPSMPATLATIEGQVSEESESESSPSEMEDDEAATNRHSRDLRHMVDDYNLDLKLRDAAAKGNSEEVKRLLDQGAQVYHDSEGTTALHYASISGFPDVVRLLVESGCDVDTTDCDGATALSKAAAEGHLDVIEVLINDNCAVDTHDDNQGNTPLHEAAMHGWSKTVDTLLRNYSNPCATNRAGNTPLHLAAQNGHNQSARVLLHGGSSPDIKNNYGDTPLHTSARYGHAGTTRILISGRASISEQNKNGDTSLHIAAAFKRRKIATLLIEGDIDVCLKNKLSETPMDIAKKKDHQEIISLLTEAGAKRLKPAESRAPPSREAARRQPSVEDTAATANAKEKKAKEKKKSSVISWIRKKLLSGGRPGKPAASNGAQSGSRQAGQKPEGANPDNTQGVFNSYKKQVGMAYYRDLAGNVRQGPAGFVPTDEEFDVDDGGFQASAPRLAHQNGGPERKRVLRNINDNDAENEDNARTPHTGADGADVESWLQSQIKRDNPFAYSVGKVHRFNDDLDQTQLSRYSVTENFPPPPRLFRCRSDETLSHSEYSYHGKAFRSRELAIEQLKELEKRALHKEKRKQIRAGHSGHHAVSTQLVPISNGVHDGGPNKQPSRPVPAIKEPLKEIDGIHPMERVLGRRANPPHRGGSMLIKSHSDHFQKGAPATVFSSQANVNDSSPHNSQEITPGPPPQHAKSAEILNSKSPVDHNSNMMKYRNKHVSFSSVHDSNETEPESVVTCISNHAVKEAGKPHAAKTAQTPISAHNLPRASAVIPQRTVDPSPTKPSAPVKSLYSVPAPINVNCGKPPVMSKPSQHGPSGASRINTDRGQAQNGPGNFHGSRTGLQDYEDMQSLVVAAHGHGVDSKPKGSTLERSHGLAAMMKQGDTRETHRYPAGGNGDLQHIQSNSLERSKAAPVEPSFHKPQYPPDYRAALSLQRKQKTPTRTLNGQLALESSPAYYDPHGSSSTNYCDMNKSKGPLVPNPAQELPFNTNSKYLDTSPGAPKEGSTSSSYPDSGYQDSSKVYEVSNPHQAVTKSVSDSPIASTSSPMQYRSLPQGCSAVGPTRAQNQLEEFYKSGPSPLPPSGNLRQHNYSEQTNHMHQPQRPEVPSRLAAPTQASRYYLEKRGTSALMSVPYDGRPDRHVLPNSSQLPNHGSQYAGAAASKTGGYMEVSDDTLRYHRQLQHYDQKMNKAHGSHPSGGAAGQAVYRTKNMRVVSSMTTDV